MAHLTIFTFGVFFIIYFCAIFQSTDGLPFDSQSNYKLLDESVNVLDTALILRSRQKRGIFDSLNDVALNILSFPLRILFSIFRAPFRIMASIFRVPYSIISNIVMGPFRIIRRILATIFSPFRLIFRTITWPARLIFNRINNRPSRDVTNSSVNSTGESTNDSVEPDFLARLSGSIRNIISNLLRRVWNFSKTNLFPNINKLIVKIGASNLVPSDFKPFFQTIHSMYEILHMINII